MTRIIAHILDSLPRPALDDLMIDVMILAHSALDWWTRLPADWVPSMPLDDVLAGPLGQAVQIAGQAWLSWIAGGQG